MCSISLTAFENIRFHPIDSLFIASFGLLQVYDKKEDDVLTTLQMRRFL